jgi:hypothetical protein
VFAFCVFSLLTTSLFELCRFEMSHPCYVVFDGHELGVYYNWPDWHRQVHRFRGACYKSTTLVKKELLPSSQEPTQI